MQMQVAWIHFERSAILTVHTHVITRNPRVSVSHENHKIWWFHLFHFDWGKFWKCNFVDWRYLHLSDVQEADRGRYLCQINTAQAKTQSAYLNVVGNMQMSSLAIWMFKKFKENLLKFVGIF